jgi:hypothetical protein
MQTSVSGKSEGTLCIVRQNLILFKTFKNLCTTQQHLTQPENETLHKEIQIFGGFRYK